jgi:antitoxin ParD1/3/4
MQLSLPPEIQKLIEDRVRSGQYQSSEDVIAAALSTLNQQETFGDFAANELEALLAEGERDITKGDVLDADQAFAALRRLSSERHGRIK